MDHRRVSERHLRSSGSGLTNGVHYYFRVTAHNAVGFGPYSTVVGAVRAPCRRCRGRRRRHGQRQRQVDVAGPVEHRRGRGRQLRPAAMNGTRAGRTSPSRRGRSTTCSPPDQRHPLLLPHPRPQRRRLGLGRHRRERRAADAADAVPACSRVAGERGSSWIVLQWQAPYSNGGAPITSYWVEIWKNGAFYYGKETMAVASLLDAFAVASYGSYEVRISARNDAGDGAYCTSYVPVVRRRLARRCASCRRTVRRGSPSPAPAAEPRRIADRCPSPLAGRWWARRRAGRVHAGVARPGLPGVLHLRTVGSRQDPARRRVPRRGRWRRGAGCCGPRRTGPTAWCRWRPSPTCSRRGP